MRGLLRATRLLRCFSSFDDPTTLLLSVLRHHDASSNAGSGVKVTKRDELSDAEGEEAEQATWRRSTTPFIQSIFAVIRSSAGEKGGAASPEPQLYFTLEALREYAMISFPEILTLWERFVEYGRAQCSSSFLSSLAPREVELLNLKLEGLELASLATASRESLTLEQKTPLYAAATQRSARSGKPKPAPVGEATCCCSSSREGQQACYTLAHFSAELGDVAYVKLLRCLHPGGFRLPRLSTPKRSRDGVLSEEPPVLSFTPASLRNVDIASPLPLRGEKRGFEDRDCVDAEHHSFEWMAENCPDHTGKYLSHLAALRGHMEYLDFLMGMLGEAVVLQQRCARPTSKLAVWGHSRYLPQLNVMQCALATHQKSLLEWMEVAHPSAMRTIHGNALLRALVAAAIFPDDATDSFAFMRSRGMQPLNLLDEVSWRSPHPNHTVSNRRRGVWLPDVGRAGLLRLLFAAAEVGNIGVLQWFQEGFDGVDVRRLCDERGATVLHHCARGGNAAALAKLLPPLVTPTAVVTRADVEASLLPPPPSQWAVLEPAAVDVEDDLGRTPAVWCVLNKRRKGQAVAVLEVLRSAGSDWSRYHRNGVSLCELAAQHHSHHSKLVRFLKEQT